MELFFLKSLSTCLVLGLVACSHLPGGAESQTSLVAFGDVGFGNDNQKKLARGVASFCQTGHCDFVALLGDNFYPSGVKSVSDPKWQTHFEEPFSQIELPFGLSIYLDYENILSYLNPHERAQFAREPRNPHVIADILIEHLFRKNHDSVELGPYLNPVMASRFFEESEEFSEIPNMCRHKSLVMKAILSRLGIEAQLMTGTIESDSGRGEHVWLYIPSINKMADPMNRMLLEPEEYQKRFNPHVHFNVTRWAKPLGILGR